MFILFIVGLLAVAGFVATIVVTIRDARGHAPVVRGYDSRRPKL